ncbi:MmgE/PrpD family protein [Corticibacterium sp. UT-5YL-CI-8]|nr:MmgE/PrpD family protein [Tianweitania sp. UT-5YL-CI-8]
MPAEGKVDSATSLARFATRLVGADVPPSARSIARTCLTDAIACAIFGSRFPWSRAVVAASSLPPGGAFVPGTDISTTPEKAALLSGVFAHAFELDSLRKPGAGVHPGATVALPALAVAQARGASGRDMITAIVAGCEVMFRVGAATLHTAEKRGFHAPGITGVFGSAVAAGKLMKLSETEMAHALGLAGSMGGGILAFAGSGGGGMVKRLHLGRAAESGIIAASLAAAGYEAPADIFETHFGLLETFCLETDASLLVKGLGTQWEIETCCFKHYPCHVTAQAPIELLAGWRCKHDILAESIDRIELAVPPKIASHHAGKHPTDMALAQYSVPFMLAFSLFNDLDDPFVLTDEAIADGRVHAMAERIELSTDSSLKGWAVQMRVHLTGGEILEGEASTFAGTPERPLTADALKARFAALTTAEQHGDMVALYDALETIDVEAPIALGGHAPRRKRA